jgi:hypothetical protein
VQLGEVEAGLVAQAFGIAIRSDQRRPGLHPRRGLDRQTLALN